MENKIREFKENLIQDLLIKTAKKGYYSTEDRGYIIAEITSFMVENELKKEDLNAAELVKEVLAVIEKKGIEFKDAPESLEEKKEETKEVKEKKPMSPKVKKGITYFLAGTVLLSSMYGLTKCTLDKDAQHEVVQPAEDEIEYDVNVREEVAQAMKFIVEDAAKKGEGDIKISEWLDFMLVSNTNEISAEALAYLYNDTRTAVTILENFHTVTNNIAVDTILVENEADMMGFSQLINDEASQKAVVEFQTLFAKLNESILKDNKEIRKSLVTEIKTKISDLYTTSKHNDINQAANITIIKMIFGGYRMDNGIMDKETAITIFGTETCDVKEGSIFNDKYKELEKAFIAKYDSIKFEATNSELVSEYDAFVEGIKNSAKPVYTDNKYTLEQMQLLATTGSMEAKKAIPESKTTTTTKTTVTNTKPNAEIKTDEAGLKQAVSEDVAKIKAEAYQHAYQRAGVHAQVDSDYKGYVASYYVNKPLSYNPESYPTGKESDTYKKYYTEAYLVAYPEAFKNYVTIDAKFDGIEYAFKMIDANRTFTESTIVYELVMQKRPTLMANPKFATLYKSVFNAAALTTQTTHVKRTEEIKKTDPTYNGDVVVIESGADMSDVYLGDIPEYAYDKNGNVVKVDLSVTTHYYLKDDNGKFTEVNFSKTK